MYEHTLRHSSTIAFVAFDGRHIITADYWDRALCVWCARTGVELRRLEHGGHARKRVVQALLTDVGDVSLVVSAETDGTVRVHETDTGKLRHVWNDTPKEHVSWGVCARARAGSHNV
jgi:hypothetical protein